MPCRLSPTFGCGNVEAQGVLQHGVRCPPEGGRTAQNDKRNRHPCIQEGNEGCSADRLAGGDEIIGQGPSLETVDGVLAYPTLFGGAIGTKR